MVKFVLLCDKLQAVMHCKLCYIADRDFEQTASPDTRPLERSPL
uniref:Uncharacterized protein n=1 Tax=Rubinisphaera brasiliensis (strain ATCC 49424 / DSM 5305 / JCM 21570 / IAM 15109 / NBRC 103401 / IFAM 1448) TaxID=756272 RepID=F0ST01_RUBBR|nr:hypothetical protein Plabr_0529 [Rubinisphaera brasiliensis DSM 5305]